MRLDPARARGRGKDEGAEGRGASLQYRASAFMPPPGKTAKDTAECRICLQTVACSELIKACGCKHHPSRSAYVHQQCILDWIARDKKSREAGCKICKQEWKFHETGQLRPSELEASRREDEPKQDHEILLALGVVFQYLWSRVKAHTASEKEEILLLEAGLQRPGPWTSWVNRTLEKQKSLFALSSPSLGDVRLGSSSNSRRGSSTSVAGAVGQPLIPSGGTGLHRRIRRSSMLRERGRKHSKGDIRGAPPGGSGMEASLMSGRPPGTARTPSPTMSPSGSFLNIQDASGPQGARSGPSGALNEAWERVACGSGTVADLQLFIDESPAVTGPWTELLWVPERYNRVDDTNRFQVLSASWYSLSRGEGGLDDLRNVVRKGKGALGPWSAAIETKTDDARGKQVRRSSIDVSAMLAGEDSSEVGEVGDEEGGVEAALADRLIRDALAEIERPQGLVTKEAVAKEDTENDTANALCWVCLIGGEIFDLHETCDCKGANQFAHADCWKSWIHERKTELLKTQCPDCGAQWKILHLLDKKEKRPVFDEHTGAEIRAGYDTAERPPTEDIKNALTILYTRVKKNSLTPRNKDLLRLVGSQFPGDWSKWIKQQVAHRRRNRLSVSGPAEELAPVEPADSNGASSGNVEGETERQRKPSIVDFIPFLNRRKSFAGFKSEEEHAEGSSDLARHVSAPKTKARDRASLPSLCEDVGAADVPDRRRSILTYTPEPREKAEGDGDEAVSPSNVDLEARMADKNRRGSAFGVFSFRHKSIDGNQDEPKRKGSILSVFSKFSRRFSVSVKKRGLFGRRITMMKTPTRMRIEADGDREAWEDQAPARGYDDYEAQMDVTCFCCYSAKPDLR